MAYTATVEKVNVSKQGNLYTASIRMTVSDGATDVFEATATARYNPNAPNMDAIKAELQAELVEKWDKWIAEQGIYTAAQFDTLVSQIQTAANNYINQ